MSIERYGRNKANEYFANRVDLFNVLHGTVKNSVNFTS